jgi:hypothetical protein
LCTRLLHARRHRLRTHRSLRRRLTLPLLWQRLTGGCGCMGLVHLVQLCLEIRDECVHGITEAREPEHHGETDLVGLTLVVTEPRSLVTSRHCDERPRRMIDVIEAEKRRVVPFPWSLGAGEHDALIGKGDVATVDRRQNAV